MGKTNIGYLAMAQVKVFQLLQLLEFLKPGIGNLGAVQPQVGQDGKFLNMRQPVIGERRVIEIQFGQLLHSPKILQTVPLNTRAG